MKAKITTNLHRGKTIEEVIYLLYFPKHLSTFQFNSEKYKYHLHTIVRFWNISDDLTKKELEAMVVKVRESGMGTI